MTVFVIVCLFLMVGGCIGIIDTQRKHLFKLQDKLNRLAATDDEIVCVLEASESPLAKKLLEVVNSPHKAPELAPHQSPEEHRDVIPKDGMSSSDFKGLVSELCTQTFDSYKMGILRQWVGEGYKFSPGQRASVLKLFTFDSYRETARKVMGKR